MLTIQEAISHILEILDSYAGPDLHTQQALNEMREEILNKFKDYVQ